MLNSLKFKLALTLSVTMLIAAILIGAIGYHSTMRDVHKLQDDHLRTIAAVIDTRGLTVNQTDGINSANLEDPDGQVLIQLIDTPLQANLVGVPDQVRFPDNLVDGIQTITVRQTEWRAFVKPWPAGGKLVVAQMTEVRDEIARHVGQRTQMRILVTIPFLIMLLTLMLHWMLKPLTRLAAELNSRQPEDIHPISDQGLPEELLPFISSANTVLQRIRTVLEQQRRFVADAAHELRSPLTALTLQTRNLTLQEMSDEARTKLGEFGQGLKRANDLVDQLLAMARAHLTRPENDRAVNLENVVRTVFEELMPFAEMKKIHLDYHQNATMTSVLTAATELDWVTVVRNLVDNAIRYCGTEGRVDLTIHADEQRIVIEVQDNGPGIVLEERDRVFDPFYRILGTGQSGSGLGLSIVKSIVSTLQGEISIGFADHALQSGTVVTVRIPQSR